jgi:hypothetical protein
MYSQQPIINWYSINLYATYYQDISTDHLQRSSTNLDEQKIVVNVIKDKSSRKSISKSKTSEIIAKKQVYTSPNTIIGSRTMEDLFQVVKNQQSTIEHVIIIDRPGEKSIPIIPSTQQPIYYNPQSLVYQQPEIYTSIPNNIYLPTTYIANAISYYPFVYFRY